MDAYDLIDDPNVEIHNGPQGNKVDGLFGLDDWTTQQVKQLAGASKQKQRDNKTRQAAKQNKWSKVR